jgi:O-antigen/teichoic acid export membrane protein
MSLRHIAFRSGIIVTGVAFALRIGTLVSTIVIARLLEPEDFGLASLSALLVGTTILFSSMGMESALGATKRDLEQATFHAFILAAISGSILTLLAFVLAPYFAQLFNREDLTALCRFQSPVILLSTLTIVPSTYLARKLMFGRRALPRIGGTLCYIIVSIGGAWAGWGVWSLVAGHIANSAVTFATMLFVCPDLKWLKPRAWNHGLATELRKFGLTSMSAGIIRYAYNHGDDIVVGKVLGHGALGFYSQAYHLAMLPVDNVSSAIHNVMVPLYTNMHDSRERLSSAFLRATTTVAACTIPMAMGMFMVAPDLIVFLIGEKWRPSIPIIQVFCFMSLLRPISGTTAPLFLALDHPNFNLRTAIIQAVTMAMAIPFFLHWGPTGVAVAVVLSFSIGFIHNLFLACKRCDIPLSGYELLSNFMPILTATLAMMGAVWMARLSLTSLRQIPVLATIISEVFLGALTYMLALLLLDRQLSLSIGSLCLKQLSFLKRFRKATTP